MGEHDQTVLHDEDAHDSIHDDGRTLDHPEFVPGAGAGAEDDYYNNTQVYRYSHGTLIPDIVHVRHRSFSVTKWESMYSALFGTGVRGDVVPWFDGRDLEVEPSFAPVIDQSYRVVGHLGWIDIGQICMRKFTDAEGTGTALHLEKARLGEEHRQYLWRLDHPFGDLRIPPGFQPATNSPPPRTSPLLKSSIDWDVVGRAPFKDGSQEQRHQRNLNFFLKAGGESARRSRGCQGPVGGERYSLYKFTGYRCLALVSPDGHLQAVLGVEKIPYESFNAGA